MPIRSVKAIPIGADYLAFNWGMRAAFSVAPSKLAPVLPSVSRDTHEEKPEPASKKMGIVS